MRQIGNLSDSEQAQTFQDYLLTRDIKSKVEQDGNVWAVWIIDEDDLLKAKEELAAFKSNPGDTRYRQSRQEATRIREALIQDAKVAKKQVVDVRQRWERPFLSRCPVTMLLIGASILVAFGSRLGEDYEPFVKALSFASADKAGMYHLIRSPDNDLRRGEVWRLVTPIFLHFNFMHILFNMLGMRDLGSAVEVRRGSLRYALIVLTIAVISNTAQYAYSGPSFGGMSGVLFGLFGYIWMRSRYDPSSGFYMPPNMVIFVMAYFFLCMLNIFGSIANMAHGAGLATGAVLGYVPIVWRDLSRR